MGNRKRQFYDIFSNNIIGLIIFISILQMGIGWAFNIHINRYLSYALLCIYILCFKKKSINKYILWLLYCVIVIFLTSKLFFNNMIINIYIEEFILTSAPIIILSIVEFDINRLNKIFFNYSIFTVILYFYCILINPDIAIKDYMTWGYNFIFGLSYLLINGIVKKKKRSILLIPFVLYAIIYGPKGGILVLISSIILSFYTVINNKEIFILLLITTFFSIINLKLTLYNILQNTINILEVNSYSLNSLLNILKQTEISGVLTSRNIIYTDVFNYLKENPFITGIGEFHNIYGTYPHNFFFDVYANFGLLLGTIIILYLYYLIYKTKKNIKLDSEKILFIFSLSNTVRLIFSKSFIWDQTFWLFIVICLTILYRTNIKIKKIY